MEQGSVSILSIGSELLDGRVQDTNANYVCAELSKHALQTRRIICCTDDLQEIKAGLVFALQNSDFVLLSGGLGPTTDDMTRQAVADFAGKPLIENELALADLKHFYAERRRSYDATNLKQVWIPEQAKLLRNPKGTAAGFSLELEHGKSITALPGVPSEFREMFSSIVLPQILDKFKQTEKLHTSCFRVFWMPEAQVGSQIQDCELPHDILVSYRANFPEVQVLLKSKTPIPEAHGHKVERALGSENIFSRSLDIDLPALIQQLLLQRNFNLSVAESCTGGLLGKLLSDIPGSSAYFLGGAISYSNQLKMKLLNVSKSDLDTHGAVSEQVAKAMAQGAQKNFGSSLALSITGIAGPQGGSPEKPVGTFYVGLADAGMAFAKHYFFLSNRANIRRFACFCALDLLRRHLLSLPLDNAAVHA